MPLGAGYLNSAYKSEWAGFCCADSPQTKYLRQEALISSSQFLINAILGSELGPPHPPPLRPSAPVVRNTAGNHVRRRGSSGGLTSLINWAGWTMACGTVVSAHTHRPQVVTGATPSPCVCVLSHAWLFASPWTVAWQAPLSMGCPRQEYWSGLPRPSPGDLPDPGIEPTSPALAGGFFYHWAIREARVILLYTHYSHFLKLGEIKQLSQCHTFMLESGSKLSLLYLIPKPQFLTIMF